MKKLFITAIIVFAALFMQSCETDPRNEQSLFSAGEDVLKRITDDNFIQEVTGVAGTGVTFYSSSNEAVAAIDAYTGEIDVLSPGISYITVSNTGSSFYKPVSGMYKLTVADNKFISTCFAYHTYPITIPVYDEYDYDYVIDWGDGGTTSGSSKIITHQYETDGIYTISISGTFPGVCFNDSEYAGLFLSIENWGAIEWQSMNGAFYGCSTLICNAVDFPDVSDVTGMNNTFNDASRFFGQDLSSWDVSNVTTHTGFSEGWGVGNTEPVWP